MRKLWPVRVKGDALALNPKARGAETLRLNCWDFGGQEIYHSAHTLFLTHRAIYLIVISKRDNERQNNVDYWLRMATSFGGPDTIIYVVVNKDDEKVGHPPDEQALRRKYPQVRGFLRTSCDDLAGIPAAREVIVREALQLDGVRLPVAKTWLAVKKKLEKMEEHTLSLQEWAKLCGKNVADENAQRELLHLCDRLGTVRYFATTQPDAPDLCDTAILNPEWVTLGIYALLDDPSLEKNGGILNRSEMTAILKKRGYPVQHERIIEEVMRRFDLLYDSNEHGSEQRMLVPLMLPELEPKISWPTDGTLEFVYQYEVMPAGLVPAFMARQHKYISKTIAAWRHGCVLHIKQCQVRVIGDAEPKHVLLSVAGPEAQRRDALDQVRATFESLHGAVKNLPVLELIPVPGHPLAPMLDYQFVRSLQWQGKSTFETKGTDFGQVITVNVREALDGVRGDARKKRDEEQRRAAEGIPQKIVNFYNGGKYNEKEENDMSEKYINTGVNQGIIGKDNQQAITNSFNTGVHGAELTKLLEAMRTAFEAEKPSLTPEQVKTVDRCLTTIEEEVQEKEPDGAVIKSMGGKLVKAIETSAKAVGLAEAATKLWDFCQQWV